MSFFRALKRIVQGKPVFDANDDPINTHLQEQVDAQRQRQQQAMMEGKPYSMNGPQPQAQQQPGAPAKPAGPASTIQKGNDRTFPVVYIKRTNTRVNGNNMQVHCYIHNSWHGEVEVDKIRLLNTTREIDTYLRPNEQKEILVYNGPKMPHDHYHEAELDYRTRDRGDYFRAIHWIGYHPQADKTFIIDEFKLDHPIRDIYG